MARRFARRRRPQVSWLPTAGSETNGETLPGEFLSGIEFRIALDGGQYNATAFNLTWDEPPEELLNQATIPNLASWGSGYHLRRIVGSFFCGISDALDEHQSSLLPVGALVTLGIGVIKVDPNDGAPLGVTDNVYNPQKLDNIRDPWVFRRSWALTPGKAVLAQTQQGAAHHQAWLDFQEATTDYSGMMEGAFFDQKTHRIVAQEERLFAVIAGRCMPSIADTSNVHGALEGYLDYRLLASLRRATNRKNATM